MAKLTLKSRHRIACGSATDPVTVAAVLAGETPHLMVTDPPYGVNYDATWRSSLDQYNQATKKVENDDRADWTEAWALFPGDVAYVWHSGLYASEVQRSLEDVGFDIRSQIIWRKPHFVISRGHYHGQHEPCWYAVKKSAPSAIWSGSRKESTVWDIANSLFQGKGGQQEGDKYKTGHSTQKPIECMKRPIENNSQAGDAIYEPFSGSGTTIIAAEMTGRHCYAIELSPAYVDVAVKRWEAFTGREAVLLAD